MWDLVDINFNLINIKYKKYSRLCSVYVTTFQVLNRRAKEKDFVKSFFAKSPSVYEDLKGYIQRQGTFRL